MEAVGVVDARPGRDAAEHVVGGYVVVGEVVHVVAGDGAEAELGGQVGEFGIQPALLGQAVILELDEEAVRAEDAEVVLGDGAGGRAVAAQQGLGDFAAEAGGSADQAGGMGGEYFAVNAGFVVEALGVADAGELDEVVVASAVLGEQ